MANAPFSGTVKITRSQTWPTATPSIPPPPARLRVTRRDVPIARCLFRRSDRWHPRALRRSSLLSSDPVAQMNYVLNQNKKTAESFAEHKRGGGGNGGNGANGGNGGPQGNWTGPRGGRNNPNVTTQAVAPVTIGSVNAPCTQITHTIPANTIGNPNPIVSSTTRCFSSDLHILVSETRTDPRFGTTTYCLHEPDGGRSRSEFIYRSFGLHPDAGSRPGRGPRGAAKPQQP